MQGANFEPRRKIRHTNEVSPTALIVEISDAEGIVSNVRRRYDPVSQRGIPAHITALYPFVSFNDLNEGVLYRVQSCAKQIRVFDFDLIGLQEFPDAIWLKPEPDAPLRALTQSLTNEFPDFAPYGGKFADPHPHLTLAQVSDVEHQAILLPELTRQLQGHLPHRCRATALSLFACDTQGEWTREHQFEFTS
jgi:2'-5' RNA ligase